MPSTDPTKRIQDFKKKEKENGKCAVCGGFSDTILMQHHSFVCSRCSGVLREVSLTVKGIAATNWTAADADKICNGGNRRERDELCGGWDGSELAVNPDSGDRDVKKFIQAKYVDKKWATGGGGGGSKPSSGGGGGGGGGGQSSSSKPPDAAEAKKFAGMFGDLTEEKAAELLKKYGSIEDALEPYLASLGSEPAPTPTHTSSKSGTKKKEEKEKKKKHHHHHKSHEEDSMNVSFNSTWDSTQTPPTSSFSIPDVQPPSLGQAAPDRIEGMAGVMGMMYRGEMDNSQMSSSWGGGGGGNASAGQFSSVPGNFGSEQQQQQQSWQQPATSSTWGGQDMPSANSFSSVPSNMGGQQTGSQNSWGQPQTSWQAPGSQSQPASQSSWQGAPGSQSQPAANPFGAMASSSQQSGQGWNSQQQSSDQQAKLQQLLKLRERKQEILRNLQQAQAAAAAGGGCCGQPANSNFGTGGQMPCSGYGGQAPNSGFDMGGQVPSSGCGGPCGFPQAPYPQSSQPCFGGPQANMYSSPPFGQAAHTQNAF